METGKSTSGLDAFFDGFRKYAVFHGRTNRWDFWWYQGITAVIVSVLTLISTENEDVARA